MSLDLNEIFSPLLVRLLVTCSTVETKKLFLKRKRFEYVTTLADTMAALGHVLEEHGEPKENVKKYLQMIFDAHLLHFPVNRLAIVVSSQRASVLVQTTAKGLAFFQKWTSENLAKLNSDEQDAAISALQSSYNTMQLVEFERSHRRRGIVISTGVVMLIWIRMLGTDPHLYHLDDLEMTIGDEATPKGNTHWKFPRKSHSDSPEPVQSHDSTIQSTRSNSNEQSIASPYYDESMMHPNSMTAMQHWDSCGVRLFKSVNFMVEPKSRLGKPLRFTVPYVLSGNAILQWVLDCTSVESHQEAVSVAMTLIKNRLVQRISGSLSDIMAVPDVSCFRDKKVPPELSRWALYRITHSGRDLSHWNKSMLGSMSDPEEIPSERKRINAKMSGTEDLKSSCRRRFNPDTWNWTDTASDNIIKEFAETTSVSLILEEPSLRMLFRKQVTRLHCYESLHCVDMCEKLSFSLQALGECNVDSRKENLAKDVDSQIEMLIADHLTSGGRLELNISPYERSDYVTALRDPSKRGGAVLDVKTEAIQLLRDAAVAFIDGDFKPPELRAYIVARYAQA